MRKVFEVFYDAECIGEQLTDEMDAIDIRATDFFNGLKRSDKIEILRCIKEDFGVALQTNEVIAARSGEDS